MSGRIVFITLGTKHNGMGHIVRCIVLADALTSLGFKPEFVTLASTPGWERLLKTKYPVFGEGDIYNLVGSRCVGAAACVIDIEHGPDRQMLDQARGVYPAVINIGGVGWAMQDPTALDNLVDLQIYQSVLIDAPVNPRRLQGADYMIINPGYSDCKPSISGPVVVSFGGSDPHDLTARAISSLYDCGKNIIVIIGQAANEPPARPVWFSFHNAPDSLIPYLDGAALFIGQTGMSAYESAAAGVPSMLVNLSPDHERTALELERRGAAWNLGMWDAFGGVDLFARVQHFLSYPDHWRSMSESGKRLVDGAGAARVADKIKEML